MTANVLLAGPILRRAEPGRVCIWLATRKAVRARAEIFELDRDPRLGPRLGAGDSERIQLGPRLFVHLIQLVPDNGAFPVEQLLGYDIELLEEGGSNGQRLGNLGLLDGPDGLAYTDLPLPSFFLATKATSLNLLHGSCRLLHGKGEDALSAADGVLARHAEDIAHRPSALYLTGDQIYGDDVAGPLIGHLSGLARALLGEGDDTSVPGAPKLSELGLYGREELAAAAGLTSTTAGNHLMSFGEFAAMHLLAWNVDNWPAALPRGAEAIPASRGIAGPKIINQRWKYAAEAKNLAVARKALPCLRRLLANTPTYMIFDDHDVSDDWNLTAAWRDGVHKSPTGRRLIANALAAYWAFQGWGNDPDRFDQPFKDTVSGFLSRRGEVDAVTFEETLWSFDHWCFHVPTDPPTIFLDTRTQRDYDSAEGAAHLIGKSGREITRETITRAGHKPGEPLIFVSPVPIYCLEMQERRQKFLKDKLGPYAIDLEGWHSNLQGLVDWMTFLIAELRLPWCLVLSGDVHYGMNLKASFSWGDQTLVITQLVSSAHKHSGGLSKTALNLLGKMARKTHERIGWKRPPKTVRASRIKRLLALRPATTDAWAEDAPVFLAPRRAQQLGIEEPPHYREAREYVPALGSHALKIVGNNNTGLLSISGDEVTHQLLCPSDGEVHIYTAAINTGSGRWRGQI